MRKSRLAPQLSRVSLAFICLSAGDWTFGSVAAAAAPDGVSREASRIAFPTSAHTTVSAAGERFPVKSVLSVHAKMRYGDFAWNDDGVSSGPVWIRVDLRHQIMSVFQDGNEVGTAVILYGADAKPTPRGRFRILARMQDHRSSLYDAPMPYTLRLTNDGVSIHGSNVRERAATHGCIGIPTEIAKRIFAVSHVGDTVTID